MLILLPPSETKTRPPEVGSPPFSLEDLSLPALHGPRETMLRAARRTAAAADGGTRLGVPASAPELVGRMLHLEAEPAAAPLRVYSGVLYDQLDPAWIPTEERRVLIQSALLGLVDAGADRIPAYRLSAGSSVSRLGSVGSWWRASLRPVAAELLGEQAEGASPLVIDARSGSYRSMMAVRSTRDVPVLAISPVQERGGARTVVSHDAKRYRGLVTRALLAADTVPSTPDEVVDVARAGLPEGLRVELEDDALVVIDPVD
ncbi:YaaA family protein [Brachybacterium sp. YJGR34]|uniref:YaaA family protein n=1 Tax=Brachybacterium sp. YJGR34 TaxID=2059911 RepID=UPI00130029D8|nr:peroxide stress protein YaaA [Brachybacterium sp. YJGR34]